MHDLEILHQFGKKAKSKSKEILGAKSYICRSYRGKTGMVKGCIHYICANLFFNSKRSTSQTRKNAFYFISKALFVLEKIKF